MIMVGNMKDQQGWIKKDIRSIGEMQKIGLHEMGIGKNKGKL